MRKVIYAMSVSLGGFIEAPDGDLSSIAQHDVRQLGIDQNAVDLGSN